MAKATVLQNLGAGKYRIKVKKDLRGVSGKINSLNAKISELESSIETTKKAIEAAESDVKTAQQMVDDIGLNYDFESDDPEYRQKYLDAQTKLIAYGKAVGNLKEELRQQYAQKLNASQDLESLQSLEIEKEVYCIAADQSDSIPVGSDVSAIEHARSGNTTAYTIRSDFDTAQDSVIVPGRKMSAWSHLYAQLVQPAVLTQRPKYWFGVIRSIGVNGLLADVAIYDRVIRSVSLSPKNSSLHTCDCDFLGSADFLGRFEVGDRVVVDFHFGSGTPTVIGFALDPGLDFEEEPFKPEPLPKPTGYELVDTFELRFRMSYYRDPAAGLVFPAWTTAEDIHDKTKWKIMGSDDAFDPNFHRCRQFTKHRLLTSTHESCTPSFFYSQAGVGVDELDFYVRSLRRQIDFIIRAGASKYTMANVAWYYRPTDGTYISRPDRWVNIFLGDAHIYYGSYEGIIRYGENVVLGVTTPENLRLHKQSVTPVAIKRGPFKSYENYEYMRFISGKIFGAETGSVRMRNLATGNFENVSDYADCVISFKNPDTAIETSKEWYDLERIYVGDILKPIYS